MAKRRLSKSRQDELKRHVLSRIRILFEQAALNSREDIFRDDSGIDSRGGLKTGLSIAHKQVALARRLAMKFNVRIPRELRRRFCKHCYHYLVPGRNCRVRLTKHKVVYYCLDCKKFMRYPYLQEIKAKRAARKGKKQKV